MMIDKSVLAEAKAFLCWDAFRDMAVQLVAIQDAVAYYYPPGTDCHSIVLFYHHKARDVSEPLFLLFHEAGHARQHSGVPGADAAARFRQMLDCDRGEEKLVFEQQAWALGRELLQRFVTTRHLDRALLERFDVYSQRCLETYRMAPHP